MNSDENNQDGDATENAGEEVREVITGNTVTLSKEEYDKLREDLGSTKRELKVLKKAKDESPETPKNRQPEGLDYGAKAFLLASGLKNNEFDFFQKHMEESGIKDPEKLIGNSYFQAALQRERDKQAALAAAPTSGEVRGGGESPMSKADYWISKGELPPDTPENRSLRQEVVRTKAELAKNSARFTKTPVVYGQNLKGR